MIVPPRVVHAGLLIRSAAREDAHDVARILREGADDGLVARSEEIDPAAVRRQIDGATAASNSLYIVATIPRVNSTLQGTTGGDGNDAQARARPTGDDEDEVIGFLVLEGAP